MKMGNILLFCQFLFLSPHLCRWTQGIEDGLLLDGVLPCIKVTDTGREPVTVVQSQFHCIWSLSSEGFNPPYLM